jgi:hypothetical protein
MFFLMIHKFTILTRHHTESELIAVSGGEQSAAGKTWAGVKQMFCDLWTTICIVRVFPFARTSQTAVSGPIVPPN